MSKYYLKNKVMHFFVFGSIYMNIEVFVRAFREDMVGYSGIRPMSLMGFTSIWMFFIGGTCCVIIGTLNDFEAFSSKKVWQQTVIGGSLITLIELFSGLLFNKSFGLNLWYYSGKYQFLNQIELKNCILWYLLTPEVIWFDDLLTYYFYGQGKVYSLLSLYKRLFKLQ